MNAVYFENYTKRSIQTWRTGYPVEHQSFYPGTSAPAGVTENARLRRFHVLSLLQLFSPPPPPPYNFCSKGVWRATSKGASAVTFHVTHDSVMYEQNTRKKLYINVQPCETYRVSHELRSPLRESVPYVKMYRYNPKHLCPKLNGYGDSGQRKVWTSWGCTHYTCQLAVIYVRPCVGCHVTEFLLTVARSQELLVCSRRE